MKTLFYNDNSFDERIAVFNDAFASYDKIPYLDVEELFLNLIDNRFKHSQNYRMKKIGTKVTDLVKINPKLYL